MGIVPGGWPASSYGAWWVLWLSKGPLLAQGDWTRRGGVGVGKVDGH